MSQIDLEKSYTRDYSGIPIALLKNGHLSYDAIFLFAYLTDLEGAARVKGQKTDGQIWFTFKPSLAKARLSFSAAKTRKCLQELMQEGIIISPRKDRYYISAPYSAFNPTENPSIRTRRLPFLRMPRFLYADITRDEEGHSLSTFDKIVYTYLLNRCMKRITANEDGIRYACASNEEMTDVFHCQLNRITSYAYRHLENVGLISRNHAESGKIYITGVPAVPAKKAPSETADIFTFKVQKRVSDQVQNLCAINKKSEIIKNQSEINNSSTIQKQNSQADVKNVDGAEESCMETIEKQIGLTGLLSSQPERKEDLLAVRDVLQWVRDFRGDQIFISRVPVNTDNVQQEMNRIGQEEVQAVLNCLSKNREHIRNLRSYLLVTLFHIRSTMNWHRDDAAAQKTGVNRMKGYKDNKFIPSHEYDYAAILEKHRRRLFENTGAGQNGRKTVPEG